MSKKKSWDKAYYNTAKKLMEYNLRAVPFQIEPKPSSVEWARTFFSVISNCILLEDYEGAQAGRDAIIEFLNELGAEIPEDAVLKIPEPKAIEVSYHLPYAGKDLF